MGSVACPGSTDQCAGNQCCPGTNASDHKTFPCPSADASYAGCEDNTKQLDCLSSSLLSVKTTCAAKASVACPGSTDQCAGNQCCPGTNASEHKTFPCPSADASYVGCEDNTKQLDCLSSSLLSVKTTCAAKASVACPGSTAQCAGNQ